MTVMPSVRINLTGYLPGPMTRDELIHDDDSILLRLLMWFIRSLVLLSIQVTPDHRIEARRGNVTV